VSESFIELGTVTAPSGVLVLGMAGWIDYWSQTGPALSTLAMSAAAAGGGHLRDESCDAEAVAVPAAAGRPLLVRASTSPSPFDGEPTIAVLEVELGVPWAWPRREPVLLGDLPVDRCGMILGDAKALDTFVGLGADSVDGLADVAYWGRHAEMAHAEFGGERLGSPGGPRGWLDLPLDEAEAKTEALETWAKTRSEKIGLMVACDEHTDYYLLQRAGWSHPLHVGAMDVAGCSVLGVEWDQGDHSMRHRGERRFGQVYPVTMERAEPGGTVLRWTIPPYVSECD